MNRLNKWCTSALLTAVAVVGGGCEESAPTPPTDTGFPDTGVVLGTDGPVRDAVADASQIDVGIVDADPGDAGDAGLDDTGPGDAGPEDMAAPQLDLTPAMGSTVNTATVTLVARYSDTESGVDLTSLTATLDGNDIAGMFTVGTASAAASVRLDNGSHTLVVSIRDNAGNEANVMTTFTIDADVAAPTITLMPMDGTTVAQRVVALLVSYADARSGIDVSSFEADLDGVSITSDFSITGGQANAASAPLAVGSHTFTASIADNAGNIARASVTFRVDVDDTPPMLTLSPPNMVSTMAREITLSAAYSDMGSGIDVSSFTATLDGAAITGDFTVGASLAQAMSGQLANGTHTFVASIADNAGNVTTATSSFSVAFDLDPPTLTIATPLVNACAGPNQELLIMYGDGGSGVNPASFGLTVNGTSTLVTVGMNQVMAPLSGLGLTDGPTVITATLADNNGNVATASVAFVYDATGPALTLSPDGQTVPLGLPVDLSAAYSDVGCSQVDLGSFAATLDMNRVTGAFTIGSTIARAQIPPVAEGTHTYSVTTRDVLMNESTATVMFGASSPAVGLELSVAPAAPSAVPLGLVQMLTVRAVTALGRTATSFTGTVALSASDGTADIDGRELVFDAADLGTQTIPATFLTQGPAVISARSGTFAASLAIQVVIDGPVIVPDLPASTGVDGQLLVLGYSFAGVRVEIVADGVVVGASTAGQDGFFGANVELTPGVHTVFARARDPMSGLIDISQSFTVTVPQPIAVGLRLEPSELALAVGQSRVIQVIESLNNGTERTVTSSATLSAMSNNAVVAQNGVVTAVAEGTDTITASFGGNMATLAVTIAPPILERSSPVHGEDDVAVTRETVLYFSTPLDPTTVNDTNIYAEFAGTRLDTTLRLTADQQRVIIFFDDPLPASSRVRVTVVGDNLMALGGAGQIDANNDGVAGGTALIDFDTLSLTFVQGTSVTGRVFASELVDVAGGSINLPLANVAILVDGSTLAATTDAMGNFRLEPAPAGRFFVHIDGATATATIPPGAYYPIVGKAWESVAGEETNVGNVHLPLIQQGSLQPVGNTDTTITFPAGVAQQYPSLVGTTITVPGGSLIGDSCGGGMGNVGIAPVDPERLPGPLPLDLDFSIVITVQSDCATNFDEPVAICFPNLDNLPAGAESALWGFSHDAGRWEIQGTMHVTANGAQVCSDPGVGVTAPGWWGQQSGSSGRGGSSSRGDPDDKTRRRSQGRQECTKNGKCDCDGTCKTGKEVLLHSGEERMSRVDLVIPGRGEIRFEMIRTYRSQLDYDGPLGHGWSFEYDDVLFREPNGDIESQNGSSKLDMWTRSGPRTFNAPAGYFQNLVERDDGTLVMRSPNGFKKVYGPDGRLQRHEDRFGNVMLFHYDARGNLDSVIDPYGREIDFVFEEVAGRQRLVSVIDFTGREVRYSYDANGDLESVRTPIVTGTPHGNDFPDGRTERYTYLSGFTGAQADLNHNIVSLTKPEEVANGGVPCMTWTYGMDPLDPVTFDRVLTETEGGTNASGVAAGGTRSFVYAQLNQMAPPGQPDLPRGSVTITKRNGNQMVYLTNEFNHHIITRELTRGLRPGEPAFYETRMFYDADGQMTRQVMPEGNELRYVYDSGAGRSSQSNLRELRRVAGPRGGGEDIVVRYTYEPLYNQVRTVTDPRGNATNFMPPIGSASAARYTTTHFFDYQESSTPVAEALEFGIDISAMARGLGDLNGDGRIDQTGGNIVRITRPTVTLRAGSNQAQRLGGTSQLIVEETAYNDRGQLLYSVDAEGHVDASEQFRSRDPDGDGTEVESPFMRVPDDNAGWIASITQDARTSPRRTSSVPPTRLQTRFGYDEVGNQTQVTNPRGITSTALYNALNEVIRTERGADVTAAVASGQLLRNEVPFAYASRKFYDANGNVVRSQEENRDDNTPEAGRWIERTYEYDILDNVITFSREVDDATSLTSRFRYDADELPIEMTLPEGNIIRRTFDERNLPFRETVGFGTPEAATTQIDYDNNGNTVRLVDAADNDGDNNPESTTIEYDGFDRIARRIDALSNTIERSYDVASNVVREQSRGHPPNQPAGTPVLLSDRRFEHDELDRTFASHAMLFVANGFTTSRQPDLRDGNSDLEVTANAEFDARGFITHQVDDTGEVTTHEYDGVGRRIRTTDAAGNIIARVHDDNGNVTAESTTEFASNDLIPSETFTTTFVYDQLDRLFRVTDNLGQTTRYAYDSRDNLVMTMDAEGAALPDPLGIAGMINAAGNTVHYFYDGASRPIRVVSDLRVGGTGAGALDVTNSVNADGQVRVRREYDGNSRLVATVDDNGNRTSFEYDALDRPTTKTMPDGTRYTMVYDGDGNIVQSRHPNGTTLARSFDVLNRLVRLDATRANGVLGTTTQTYAYDGLSRPTRSTDSDGVNTVTVEHVFDSLGRRLERRQDGAATSRVFTGDGRPARITYPGGRVIDTTFDAIDRPITMREGATSIAAMHWAGPGLRPIRTDFGNTTQEQLTYDGMLRVTRQTHRLGTTAFVDRRYGYNRMDYRLFEQRDDDGGMRDSYAYDSLYRIEASRYDEGGAGTPRDLSAASYQLDGAGNRRQVELTSRTTGQRFAEFVVNDLNQYSQVETTSRNHDANGNLLRDRNHQYAYDFADRLVEVRNTAGDLISRYQYDAFGQRSRKITYDAQGMVDAETEFLYDGLEVIEERDGAGATIATYVAGADIDHVIQVRSAAGTEYLHSNERGDIVAVTDAQGSVLQRYRYDDFGAPDQTPAGANPYLYQGRRYDAETGLYYFRARYYDPQTGRFLQRDSEHDRQNHGNLYAFVGNSPVSTTDPMGTTGKKKKGRVYSATKSSVDLVNKYGNENSVFQLATSVDKLDKVIDNGKSAARAFKHAKSNFDFYRSLCPALTKHLPKVDASKVASLRVESKVASKLASGAKGLKWLGAKANVIGAAAAGGGELINGDYEGTGGKIGGGIGVGAVQYAAGSNPYATILLVGSSLTDEAFEAYGKEPPKLAEVYNNAGRAVGYLGDLAQAAFDDSKDCRGRKKFTASKATRRFVRNLKSQGWASREVAKAGEWHGKKYLYKVFSWGEDDRSAKLEAQRQRLLRARR